MTEDHSNQFWTLRRYLKQHHVPMTLNVRIQRYLDHAWARQKRSVSEPKLLQLLSVQLTNELQCARSVPPLVVHPLFHYLNEISDVTVQRLAVNAISRQNLARGDRLFFPGETATHVYFVVAGRMRYDKAVEPTQSNQVEWVDKNEDWISEPVLWTPAWVHLGILQAHTEAELLLIDASKFGGIVSLTPAALAVVRHYARSFLKWMNQMSYDSLSDISQGEDISDKLRQFITDSEELIPADLDSEELIPVASAKPAGKRNKARTFAWTNSAGQRSSDTDARR
uniref:Cyclic nucleotide-binding domain-containing protein n=1 Tax=Alexandrium andersonii TaxID=327968 RepID=A0A7S2BT85_9DINO|mmetsp:Transcript_29731/g.67404  ORF Transcript_29731/g.67404 Transcript_29731/m.67404 type:complete len:282 (+) Transcript_29731:125-970(+)